MSLGHIALLVLLPLIQLPAILYLSRYFEVEDTGPRMREFDIDRPESAAPDGACRHCGARNDPVYRYCRRCVAKLPP